MRKGDIGMGIKNAGAAVLCCFLLLDLLGCESFVRKFTRKPKKQQTGAEMVLAPEEYKGPDMSKEELYRQYYLYWGSWQDELINALNQGLSLKKKIDCAQEALKNLINMKMMLVDEARANFDPVIARMNRILSDIKGDIYGRDNYRNARIAENIKVDVHLGFAYSKIRNYLK